jgi:hypothetical protein
MKCTVFHAVFRGSGLKRTVQNVSVLEQALADWQAHGDLRVMAQRNRRLLYVHIGPDVATGWGRLASELLAVVQSLSKPSIIA